MSITSEIQRIRNNIANAYTGISAKGGTLPSTQNISNLKTAINSISDMPDALIVPVNNNGLCFWLDGDCNTRTGVNRNKKYFENLLWLPDRDSSSKNIESIKNSGSNNVWNNNILNVYDFACYPYLANKNESYSVECVVKLNQSLSGSANSSYIISTTYAGGFSVNISTSDYIGFYIGHVPTSGSSYEYLHPSMVKLTVGKTYYFCFTYNASTKKASEYVLHTTPNKVHASVTLNTLKVATDTGIYTTFGSQCYTSYSSEHPTASTRSGKFGVGMIRYWRRELSLTEVKTNYQDAKKRFGCL